MTNQFEIVEGSSWNTALVAAILLVIFLLFSFRRKYHGPWGLPYFGIVHMIQEDFYLKLIDMARKKYGEVFVFKVTGQLFAHLATYEAIREVHVKKADCFNQRLQTSLFFELAMGKGLILEKGERWKVRRKFIVQVLRELSSKEVLGSSFDFAVNDVLNRLRESKGTPITPMEILHDPYVDVVRGIIVSDSNKHLVHDILSAYMSVIDGLTMRRLFLAGSIVRWFALRFAGYREINAHRKEMERLLAIVVRKRELAVSTGNIENTLIDRYFQERNSRLQRNDPQAEFFDADSLVETLVQLFGDLCTGVTPLISSFLGDLASKPDVQERMREEMFRELGENLDRNPSVDDKVRLPYVNAVLKELLRCSPFFPLLPNVQCVTETTICGVRIPVGCTAILNSWAANHDPKVYDEPDKFMPERFLPSAPKTEQPILFGIGRRSCIGEAISWMGLFLFVSAIVRNFVIKPEIDTSNMRSLVHSTKMKIRVIPVGTTERKSVN